MEESPNDIEIQSPTPSRNLIDQGHELEQINNLSLNNNNNAETDSLIPNDSHFLLATEHFSQFPTSPEGPPNNSQQNLSIFRTNDLSQESSLDYLPDLTTGLGPQESITKEHFKSLDQSEKWNRFKEMQEFILKQKTDLEEYKKQIESLKKESKENSLLSWRTINDKMKQDVEFEILKRKYERNITENRELKHNLESKIKEIAFLKQDLESKNEANFQMALKLLDYKTKVSSVELQLRKFPVKHVYRFYPNVDVDISVLKNPQSGLISFDIEENRKHTTHPLKAVLKLSGYKDRFQVVYADSTAPDIFESERCSEIISALQEILSLSKED